MAQTASFDPAEVAAFQFHGQDVPWLLDHWATHRAEHPFLIWEPFEGGGRSWTYAEFAEATRKVAAGLVARGVSTGDMVLIHADNCPEAVISWYACARVGAVAVTTNTRSVAAEVRYFIEHTGCVGAITQPRYSQLLAGAGPDLGWVVVTEDDSGAEPTAELAAGHEPFSTLEGDEATFTDRPAEPLLPAGILFTSGTTSKPKAVVHTHANALWAAKVNPTNIDLRAEDVYLASLPFFHVNSQSWAIWSALGVGATVVLQPKFSASRFWPVIAKHSVTHISLLPFVIQSAFEQGIPEDHTVKVGVFGLVMPVLEQMMNMRVVAAYGMTELVTHCVHSNPFEQYPEMAMGKVSPGYEMLVVKEDGSLAQVGEMGELWIRGVRGVSVCLEYFGNAEATEKFFTEDGWARTGDIVKLLEDGNIRYCDRDKDALKVGGENVSAREVEDVIRAAGVPLADIAVVAKSHERLDMVPVAFAIKGDPNLDEDSAAATIIEHCRANLADFKVPRAVYFVDEFPTAELGKVSKKELREHADSLPAV
jgi:crotonobetaine/carnitine-CoA ligase